MTIKHYRILTALLLFGLLAVSSLSYLTYKQALGYYREIQAVRLDPANLNRYPSGPPNNLIPDDKKVVLLGDSRIAQWQPQPSLNQAQVINRGVSAETSAQTLLRLTSHVIDLQPDMVVIQIGINDLKAIGVFPQQKAAITQSCRENCEKIVNQLHKHNIKIIILTIFPPFRPELMRRPVWSDDIVQAIKDVNNALKISLADKATIIDCNTFFLHDDGKMKSNYAVDTFHINAVGYAELNRQVEPVLQAAIDQLLEN